MDPETRYQKQTVALYSTIVVSAVLIVGSMILAGTVGERDLFGALVAGVVLLGGILMLSFAYANTGDGYNRRFWDLCDSAPAGGWYTEVKQELEERKHATDGGREP